MTRSSGVFRGLLFAATLFAAAFSADSASAWGWRSGYAVRWRPFCGPGFSYSYSSYASSVWWGGWCGPRVYGYSCHAPYAYGCHPSSYSLGCHPAWNGWGWNGYGWNGWACLPSAYGPVYGPAGVVPFLGFASASPAVPGNSAVPGNVFAANRPDVNRVPAIGRAGAGKVAAAPFPIPGFARGRDTAIVRSSNTAARMRAGKLVAIGDRHLQSAVSDRASLSKALDAYKRAATIAADQPDTFLRQAIVLVAMERQAAADAAIARAVAIDARLGDDPSAAREAARTLPPDPVFGDRPEGEQTVLASRTTSLISRIFRDGDMGVDAGSNWIAKRWTERFGGDAASRLAAK